LPTLVVKKGTTKTQQIVGSLLYYVCAVDPNLLVALGSIVSNQNKSTAQTADAITKILNYATTLMLVVIKCSALQMIIHVHSDASYLSEKKAQSLVGGFFLSSPKSISPNGPVHTVSHFMRNVMFSAAAAKIGTTFASVRAVIPLHQALIDLGHPQPPTPMSTDNSNTNGVLNESIRAKRTKAIDMRFHSVLETRNY